VASVISDRSAIKGVTVAESSIDPERLLSYLGPGAEQRLRHYFLGDDVFTGRWFERFAGGGERPEARHRFTAEDLVAVTFLSVSVPPKAAWSLLEDCAGDFNELLRRIPADQDLWEVSRGTIEGDSAADLLWHELDRLPGVGWVTAGKLLARKRPRLIPIYDDVVQGAFGLKKGTWWKSMHDVLTGNPEVIDAAQRLRTDAGIEDISILRVIDVSVWMTGRT
jgi:hypothetical protein